MQALPAVPESLLMLYGGSNEGGADSGLFLQVALQNGVLMRTEVSCVRVCLRVYVCVVRMFLQVALQNGVLMCTEVSCVCVFVFVCMCVCCAYVPAGGSLERRADAHRGELSVCVCAVRMFMRVAL